MHPGTCTNVLRIPSTVAVSLGVARLLTWLNTHCTRNFSMLYQCIALFCQILTSTIVRTAFRESQRSSNNPKGERYSMYQYKTRWKKKHYWKRIWELQLSQFLQECHYSRKGMLRAHLSNDDKGSSQIAAISWSISLPYWAWELDPTPPPIQLLVHWYWYARATCA